MAQGVEQVRRIPLTRRRFVEMGSAAAFASKIGQLQASEAEPQLDPMLRESVAKLEYLTPWDRAFTLDKGKAEVAKLPPDKLRDIGLLPETWSLEIVPDLNSDCAVDRPLTRQAGTAINWDALMRLAERHAVRFLHVTTCTNGADPFHMSLWEGVPLREILWLTGPKDNIRRVYYQSYHKENLHPFQSSLAMGQVLESRPGEIPAVLAYKRNGQYIPASHGGPVRMLVPGSYGSKSIKWLQRIVLTNDFKANDSDADLNNDPENPLKTRARFINEPKEAPPGKPIAITGMAQVGMSGLRNVQYCVYPQQPEWPTDDPYRAKASWKDASILPPPANWGGGLPGGKLPPTSQTNPSTGQPLHWPLRYTLVHWTALVPALPAGTYQLCCRTIDENGIAQPMPRALPRTGFNSLHIVTLVVK